MKIKAIFPFLAFLIFFTVIPNVNGQDSYNVFTLEYFKQSLESLMIGDYDNAIRNSTFVINRDPNSSVAYTIRGRAYFEKGDMTNAIRDCSQAVNLDRNNISALSVRANAYVKTNDMNRAIADWRTILRLNPDNESASHNIELARGLQSVQQD